MEAGYTMLLGNQRGAEPERTPSLVHIRALLLAVLHIRSSASKAWSGAYRRALSALQAHRRRYLTSVYMD